jgi:ankyrin repeat protein
LPQGAFTAGAGSGIPSPSAAAAAAAEGQGSGSSSADGALAIHIAGIDVRNHNGDTPLMFAASSGHLGATALLLNVSLLDDTHSKQIKNINNF